MARLKIATYNINGVRARHDALLEWLEREKPDVACLQELKAPDEAFPQLDVERLGYGAIWHGQKAWNGVAILARGTQPQERQRGLPEDPDGTQSRYLEADVHGLRVACLYLPNGNPQPGPKFAYKLAWFAELRRRTAALLRSGKPAVVCGDFNVVPTDELDIYNAKSWRNDALLQPETRKAWFALLEQGWTDAIRTIHGDEKIYTFWDYFRKHWERDAGLRIDHLLLSPDLAPMLRDANVDRWVRGRQGASDHAPTWVLLDASAAGARRTASKKSAKKESATKKGVATKTIVPKKAAPAAAGTTRKAGATRGKTTLSSAPKKRSTTTKAGSATASAKPVKTSAAKKSATKRTTRSTTNRGS